MVMDDLPLDKLVVLEHFRNELGQQQIDSKLDAGTVSRTHVM